MKRITLSLLLLGGLLAACQQNPAPRAAYNVVPLPASLTQDASQAPFILSGQTVVAFTEDLAKEAAFLQSYIQDATQINVVLEPMASAAGVVLAIDPALAAEAYTLDVTAQHVRITGGTAAGVFYGIQTLRKSLPVGKFKKVELPCGVVQNSPRFGYRGMMLDVSRHFFTVDEVKQYIDMLALHQMNRFHWHLTEDQGWRIEMKKYPKLTEIGSMRSETVIGHNTSEYDGKPHGGFYTQEEIKDVIAYAQDRHITIVPEIDLPGHMEAALASYPELGCTGGPYEVERRWGVFDEVLCPGKPATFTFIEDILNELMDLFPGEFIHIGGDECPKVRWKECPDCQALIKKLGLKGDKNHTAEQRLQSYVTTFAEGVINARGRRLIGWDEILEGGLAPNATVMAWRGAAAGLEAARLQHDAIMTPTSHLYFDYYQSTDRAQEPDAIGGYVPLEKVYSFDPIPAALAPEDHHYILGVQANLWTEYIDNFPQVMYMALPRGAALCEIQWLDPAKKDYKDFQQRLLKLMRHYDIYGYNYAKHIYNLMPTVVTNPEANCIEVTLETIDNAPIYYTLDGTDPTPKNGQRYTGPVAITSACTFKACAPRKVNPSRLFTDSFQFNKATGKSIEMRQPINPPYAFGGKVTLVDGLVGDGNYKTGRWVGFYGNDLDAVIDLGEEMPVSTVAFNACVEKGDWIFGPRSIKVALSSNATDYTTVFEEQYPSMTEDNRNGLYTHKMEFAPTAARYVRLTVGTEEKIPAWHGGAGHTGYLFVDEICID